MKYVKFTYLRVVVLQEVDAVAFKLAIIEIAVNITQ